MDRVLRLLDKGLLIKGTFDKVKTFLPYVEEYEGVREFTNSDCVKATLNVDTFIPEHIFNMKNIFFDRDTDYVIKIDPKTVITDKMELISAKEFFTSDVKEDKRKNKIKEGDVVSLRYYCNDNVIFALNGINLKKNKEDIAYVKSVKNGVMTLDLGLDWFVDLPTICGVKIKVWDKDFQKIVNYMKSENIDPIIDGSMMFLSVSDDGTMIEYILPRKLKEFNKNFYDKELRAKYGERKKIRKVLKSIFKCNGDIIENAMLFSGKNNLDVEILEGKDLLEIFVEDSCSKKGSIGASRMRDKPENFFDIYVENAKAIRVRNKRGKIHLRALSWDVIDANTGKKIKFMDRIYSDSTANEVLLMSWAKENGYYHLKNQTYSETEFVNPKGKMVSASNFYVNIKSCEYEKYPYIDTFCIKAGRSLYTCNSTSRLQSTQGDND